MKQRFNVGPKAHFEKNPKLIRIMDPKTKYKANPEKSMGFCVAGLTVEEIYKLLYEFFSKLNQEEINKTFPLVKDKQGWSEEQDTNDNKDKTGFVSSVESEWPTHIKMMP